MRKIVVFFLLFCCGIFELLTFRKKYKIPFYFMQMWVGETIVFLCDIFLSGGGYIQLFTQGRKIEVDKVFS